MITYLTADLHIGCKNLIKNTRKAFESIDHHDNHIFDRINSIVGKRDRLIIAGDLADKSYSLMKLRQRIACKNVWVVLGNHDKQAKVEQVFGATNVRFQLMVKPEFVTTVEQMVFVAHFPHAHWDRSHYGIMHAYGHVHSRKEEELDRFYPQRRSIDVGVDNIFKITGDYRPVSLEWMYDRLMDRGGHDRVSPEDRWPNRDY